MRETVFFGAATGLPILFPMITITVPPPARHAGAVVAQSDHRRREDRSPAPRGAPERKLVSSPHLPAGDRR